MKPILVQFEHQATDEMPPMPAIESYALYGEEGGDQHEDILHCETLRSRAVMHDWRFRPHRHHGMHQLFWIDAGEGRATIDGVERRISSSTAISIPPMAVHGFVFQPDVEGWVVTLPIANFKRILANSNIAAQLGAPAVLSATRSATALFAEIAEEFGRFTQEREQALISLAGLLVVWFTREIAASPAMTARATDRGRDLVLRFIQHVEADFTSDRHIATFAASMGVTPTHLSRLCRKFTGRSASVLVQDRLALEGRRQLTYTSRSVSEIAYSLGFHDPAHFSKFFRKQTGRSPSAYRAKILGQC